MFLFTMTVYVIALMPGVWVLLQVGASLEWTLKVFHQSRAFLIYVLCCANVETSIVPNPVVRKTVPSNHYHNQTALPIHSTSQNSFLLGVSALSCSVIVGSSDSRQCGRFSQRCHASCAYPLGGWIWLFKRQAALFVIGAENKTYK